MYSRQSKASERVHNSHRFLSHAEKDERLNKLQRAKVAESKCNKRLSEKLNELVDKEGLTEQDTSDVASIFIIVMLITSKTALSSRSFGSNRKSTLQENYEVAPLCTPL